MRKATILLVEDEPSMLHGMRDLLQLVDIGYDVEVLTASNGRAGLNAVKEHPPDLIVSDIMMPQMNGYQFLENVRQNPAWTHIPFIFLTAKGDQQDIHKGRVSGANLYITKPFNSRELVELVKVQLDRTFELQETRQRDMNGLKRDILQILNHEFRTPLTYVTAYLDMIMVDGGSGNDNFREYLRGIQAGCVRLTRLVKDFIQVLELRTGEAEADIRQGATIIEDIPQLLKDVIEQQQQFAIDAHVQVKLDLPQDLPPLYGDRSSLTNALGRILNNAIKFTHSQKLDGNVYVSAGSTDNEVKITIRDEGIGFPEHVQNDLFDLFFQYNRSTFEQQGAGIGLTIAKEMIEIHGGYIDIESSEKEGSVFTAVLPVYGANGDNTAAFPVTNGRKKATVLVVEDDYYLLAGLQELLEIFDGKYNLDVLAAANGRQGLQILEKHQPNLIISDIMMPEMGGYEFLDEVRKNPNWVQIPFIFLTAKGERRDIHMGRRSGVEEYITKPYDSDQLLELVVTQLDRHFQVQGAVNRNFESLKRSILQLISSDMRQPLSSVSQHSEKLEEALAHVKTDQELKLSLRLIQKDSVRLTHLVEDFITLAEIRTGEAETAYELRAQPISNPGLMLREVQQLYPRSLGGEETAPTIHCAIGEDLPSVFGVSTMITDSVRRLINLCRQRLGLAAEDSIRLSAIQANDEVHLSIHCPCTLTDEETERLSTLLDEETLASENLIAYTGLQIAQGNIALHNGRVFLNTNDDGYTFTMALPTYQQEPTQTA